MARLVSDRQGLGTAARSGLARQLVLRARLAGGVGGVLAVAGVFAFNLGYIGLYWAFLPLLGLGAILFIEVGEDFFLSLVLLASAGTLVYGVGLFALPVIALSVGLMVPLSLVLQGRGVDTIPSTVRDDAHPGWRTLELVSLLLIALFARYAVYRSGGGRIPLQIGEFGPLVLFVLSELSGWVVFALGYGWQHRLRYGVLYTPGLDFASSLPSLVATGVFLVSPYVAIMTLGLNTVGIAGLYLGCLPVGAAHIFMRTLTLRRAEIARQNLQLQEMTRDLLRNERMAAIGQISSTLSHQLLQKVGLLGLQCDLLQDSLRDENVSPTQRLTEVGQQAEQLDEAIRDLNATLSDLLIFSRDVAVQRESHIVAELLREVTHELQSVAAVREVELVYTGAEQNFRVSLDRIKFKQALINLVTNAIDASPPGGRVELVLSPPGERVQVAICDQGEGIVEADLEHIFLPFFSTKESGSGLGLPFAQKIIELHQGTLRAYNNAEGGATFMIEIPRHSADQNS